MTQISLRDYLCAQSNDGPWTAIFATGHEAAATQFARSEMIRPGDVVFVGIASPVPHVFSSELLVRFITERLGINAFKELEEMATGLAGEANHRMQRLASDKAAKIGRALNIRPIEITEEMSVPQFSRAV
jgi:hypothetical protein